MDFLKNYDELTVSEKKVLRYVIDNTKAVPYMNINQLADVNFVSKTVIINLCQKLGFSGFKELKFTINNSIREELVSEELNEDKVIKKLEKSIEKTLSLVIDETIDGSVDSILQAKNIFIMARGTSKPVGYYLEHLLFSMGLHCFFIDDYNLSESFTRLVTEDDVVILFSLSGQTKKILETARVLNVKGAKMISITSFQSNKLSDYSDYSLYCHTDNFDTKKDDSISRIGFFLLVDLLIESIKQKLSNNHII
ncbi:MurR/RpiR family transcriptional regulator [Vagococcus hydrophili]|uniref:MurR/RpiR family transcriptional regulator n=1 Tax=Vagococcus hydrophili TaxID=2714947 RepID=A0A6G8AVD6_9ENTE|nr:MurR/RpiR family transcriptional regulator [Vagococcus hydrophili]QIL49028.1 MurR/RpiR family transcriptional regulator [Vagococcus hydrophili]